MKLFIVRHGQTIQNLEKTYQGQLGGDLSDVGKKQAYKLAERLKDIKFDIAYCSDLKRAKETCDQIMIYHPNTEVIFSKELRERSWGELEGKSIDKHRIDINDLPIGVETSLQMQTRVINFFERIYKTSKDKTVLFVTHSSICRLYAAHFLKIGLEDMYSLPRAQNTGLYEIDVNDDNINILLQNDISHLN